MIDLELLRRLETTCYADLADVERRPYGLLYHCADNPLSHDANHGVILDLDIDLEAATADVTAFYEGRGLEPRLYPSFTAGEVTRLRPVLERCGYAFREEIHRLFVLRPDVPAPVPPPGVPLDVRRVRALSAGVRALIHSDGPAPWTERAMRRHLGVEGFHLLVGLAHGAPVTMAAIKVMDGLSRVDDVLTHPLHRRRGYARALMATLVAYYREVANQPLYLYAENPVAIRIYEEVGLVEEPLPVDQWTAWKPQPRR
jgi:GNAT superfamily N-acetyltransferase